jgi:hypothetical protein
MDKTRAAKMYDLKIFPTKTIERRVSFDGYGNLKNLVTKLQDAFMELGDEAYIEAVTYDDGDMDHFLCTKEVEKTEEEIDAEIARKESDRTRWEQYLELKKEFDPMG